MTDGDKVLTVMDVARLVGVSKETVWAAIRRGDLPAKKFGSRAGYRIRWADYAAWLATPSNPKEQGQ